MGRTRYSKFDDPYDDLDTYGSTAPRRGGNVVAILAGALAILAFFLPWLSVTTIGWSAQGYILATAGTLITGGWSASLCLLPLAGLVLAGASLVGIIRVSSSLHRVGVLQLIMAVLLCIPVVVITVFYLVFIDATRRLIGIALPVEAFIFLDVGYWLALLAVGIAAIACYFNLMQNARRSTDDL